MKPQLLCTFTTISDIPVCVSSIVKLYDNEVANMKCYEYTASTQHAVCVYNVFTNEKKVRDTITINRKKETNTLYSINALNAIIKIMNNGVLDKSYILNWLDYADCLLLGDGDDNYKKIEIKELDF